MNLNPFIHQQLEQLNLPDGSAHKGQNGKVLIIGGSELFHAASKWSLDVVSRLVDMVFYSSVPSNNQLILEAKSEFWNGIVVERDQLEEYLVEADVILIGPGMDRSSETEQLTNRVVSKHPHKKWVIDAGALQMIEPDLIPATAILTPHQKEFARLIERLGLPLRSKSDSSQNLNLSLAEEVSNVMDKVSQDWLWHGPVEVEHLPNLESELATDFVSELRSLSRHLNGVNCILKGQTDLVFSESEVIAVRGGNAGLTKGGTGDVLAGLVAGLYAYNTAATAAVVASIVNKLAGEELAESNGVFFNASDLAEQVPMTLAALLKDR